jgi:hypothetical protein
MMALADTFRQLPDAVRAAFADELVSRALEPAFGALPKTELDLLVFQLLLKSGALRETSPIYETARALRVTPAKIRSLMFQIKLRDPAATEDSLRAALAQQLSKLKFARDGEQVVFGIEDPLLQADVVARLKKLDVTPDFSFNRELLKIPLSAFVDLLDVVLDATQKREVIAGLNRAGFPDTSFRGVVVAALGKLAEKFADEAGKKALDALADAATPALGSFLSQGAATIAGLWTKLVGGGASPATTTET